MHPAPTLAALALVLSLPFAGIGAAEGWSTPAIGSDLRQDLLAAVRPHAEWALGRPVSFVVHEMRVAGGAAFVSLTAVRPGGGAIAISETPGFRLGDLDPDIMDGTSLQALLLKSGRMWVAVQHAIGPTDAWWTWDAYCADWGSVLPESCP